MSSAWPAAGRWPGRRGWAVPEHWTFTVRDIPAPRRLWPGPCLTQEDVEELLLGATADR